jgi:hypothetical protein
MFTEQAPGIGNALVQGGMAPPQAFAFQNFLGQCRQKLKHRGPVEIDPTVPAMRLVGPDGARTQFPNFGDLFPPEHRKKPKPEEEPDRPPNGPLDPPPGPGGDPEEPGPGGGGDPKNLRAGDYIEIINDEIHLAHNDFTPGRHCIFQDGRVRGIDFTTRETSTENDGDQLDGNHIVLDFVVNRRDQTVLEYGLKNLVKLLVVTDVRFYPDGVPGETDTDPVFRVTRQPILAWLDGIEETYDIPLSKCDSGGTSP